MFQGTIVATSAHPVLLTDPAPSTLGMTCGTFPSTWSASRSFSHLAKKLLTFMLNEAVREKTCASPDHPSLSSRCGQSVGTSRKLPFCPCLLYTSDAADE